MHYFSYFYIFIKVCQNISCKVRVGKWINLYFWQNGDKNLQGRPQNIASVGLVETLLFFWPYQTFVEVQLNAVDAK